jgi:hypothetical protein
LSLPISSFCPCTRIMCLGATFVMKLRFFIRESSDKGMR